MTDDIMDRIDALVDDQLAGGEPQHAARRRSTLLGYDYGNPTYPKCPHCQRHWHGLPITQQVVDMYDHGEYDESYRVDEDDSEIVCPGSTFIGPMPAPYKENLAQKWMTNSTPMITSVRIYGSRWQAETARTRKRWWRTQLPSDARYRCESNQVTVRTGVHYEQTFDADMVRIHHRTDTDQMMIAQSDAPIRVNTYLEIDVLSDTPPRLAGTHAPLTNRGNTTHPDDDTARWVVLNERGELDLAAWGFHEVGRISGDGIDMIPDQA